MSRVVMLENNGEKIGMEKHRAQHIEGLRREDFLTFEKNLSSGKFQSLAEVSLSLGLEQS
jgi:hypothetical protein